MESPETQTDKPVEISFGFEGKRARGYKTTLSRQMRELVDNFTNERNLKPKRREIARIGSEITSKNLAIEIVRNTGQRGIVEMFLVAYFTS